VKIRSVLLPREGPAMDPLSDVLRAVRLSGAYFYAVEARNPWGIETVAATQLVPRVLPDSEHLISYHIITEGRCFGGVRGEPPLELLAGDVIVFPHGDPHIMSGDGDQDGPDYMDSSAGLYAHTVQLGPRGRPDAMFVCGFLGCDLHPFNPLLATLPRQLHVRGISQGWLGVFSGQVVAESRKQRVGGALVLTRLAELMFIEVLRRHLETLGPEQTGWLAALRDPVVGRALALMHERAAHPWSLVELAAAAATSRSQLAERFTHLVGQPPMQYLAQWRMQLAAGMLVQGGVKVATVASAVGYDSEAAFSRAFKKATGLAPGAWREARGGG
jgi:AraC-like DNA-binding protein